MAGITKNHTGWLRNLSLSSEGEKSKISVGRAMHALKEEGPRNLRKNPSSPLASGSLLSLVCRRIIAISITVFTWPSPLHVCVSASKFPSSHKDISHPGFRAYSNRV